MNRDLNSYEKGELVPEPGTYRCTACGELWTTEEVGVRFPPCDACKSGEARWMRVAEETRYGGPPL